MSLRSVPLKYAGPTVGNGKISKFDQSYYKRGLIFGWLLTVQIWELYKNGKFI